MTMRSIEGQAECQKCRGSGSTSEHDSQSNHHPGTGECITCPVQVMCEECRGEGIIDLEEVAL